MINGFNPACLYLLPMLGRRQNEWPRFRDCFLSEDHKRIVVYTRVGGANRNSGYGEEALYKDPDFVKTYDDEFDDTYGYYEFNPPERWREDFDKLVSGKPSEVSKEYIEHVIEFFHAEDKEKIYKLFGVGGAD